MTRTDFRFKEIEHKYIVGDEFDVPDFRDVLARLGPQRTYSIRVRDRYYLTASGRERRCIVRHRFDTALQQLTVKALGPDTEVRDEVNIDLGQHAGDQTAHVEAFLAALGVEWSGTVQKDVDVWYFEECEIVYYVAASDSRSVRCVEFEARRRDSLGDALTILDTFEGATGFRGLPRSRLSLPQLLFPELSERLVG